MDDEQEIDIPWHFLCPISLELMRDPVTLSTGITYDRDSIESWLFSWRNNSCPVTKQPLITPGDLLITPNHTLRRLIHGWCKLNHPNPPASTRTASLLSGDLDSLHALCTAAAEGGEPARSRLESAGAIEHLAAVLHRTDSSASAEVAVEALHHLASGGGESSLRRLTGEAALDSLAAVMARRDATSQARARAASLLHAALGAVDPARLGSLKPAVFASAAALIRDDPSPQATKPAVKILASACPWGRNRARAAVAGAVPALVELLLDHRRQRRVVELAVAALEVLCGCAEGRAGLVGHPAGVAALSKKILRVSPAATDRAVRALAALCRRTATPRVLQEMVQVGAVAKLCAVVEVETSFKTKSRAVEILRLHSRVWKASPCFPPHLLSSYPS